jgi:hypothetical protein
VVAAASKTREYVAVRVWFYRNSVLLHHINAAFNELHCQCHAPYDKKLNAAAAAAVSEHEASTRGFMLCVPTPALFCQRLVACHNRAARCV